MLLHSLNVDIRSRSLDLEDALSRLYADNDLTGSLAPARPLTLCLERRDSTAALPIGPIGPRDGVFAETNLCGAPCFYADGRFYAAADGESWRELDYDVERGTVRANLGRRYSQDPVAVVIGVLRAILQSFVLPFHGLRSLHGAVVTRGDRTLMLTGPGGAGKSTTALRLLADGWDVLSDDAPLFAYDGMNALALSSLDYFHVTRETLELLPWLAAHAVGETGVRDKLAIRARDLQPSDGWRRPQRVTDLIELCPAAVTEPRLTCLSGADATASIVGGEMVIFRAELIRSGGPRFSAYSSFLFDLLASLTSDARVRRLEFDRQHLRELPGLVADCTAGV